MELRTLFLAEVLGDNTLDAAIKELSPTMATFGAFLTKSCFSSDKGVIVSELLVVAEPVMVVGLMMAVGILSASEPVMALS